MNLSKRALAGIKRMQATIFGFDENTDAEPVDTLKYVGKDHNNSRRLK
ncbi:MAG: hypothetical protein H8D87_14360 [Deltaproteobacteria bacterium]|nr:hypothetical protein [Candidatus Desulfobacula maris]MBL6993630.1 hypothetical protein [Desulfobacula sp.]